MAFTRTRAAKLLTKAEMDLFNASLDRESRELPPGRLAGKVKRARNLRDKYRDLYQRQTRASRRNARYTATRGPANERTAQKAQAFDEVLKRLEKLARRGKAAGKAKPATQGKTASKRKATTTRKAASKRKATTQRAAAPKRKPLAKRKTAAAGKARRVPVRSSAELVRKKREAQARQLAARQVELSPKAPAHGPRESIALEGEGSGDGQVRQDTQRFQSAGAPRIQGHVSTTVRSNQAKRDQRG